MQLRAARVVLAIVLLPTFADSARGQVEEWRVGAEPEISIGDLYQVRGAVVLDDGGVLILNAGTHELRIYDADGRFVRSVGREGQGPGEFQGATSLRRLASGETLVYDGAAQRLTQFEADWEVGWTRRVPFHVGESAPTPVRLQPMASGLVPIPSFAVELFELFNRPEGLYNNDTLEVALYDGTDVVTSFRRARGPTYSVKVDRLGLIKPLPFGEFVLYAAGPRHVVFGTSHGTGFSVLESGGELIGHLLAMGTPRRVTLEDASRFEEQFLREFEDPRSMRGISIDRGPQAERFLKQSPRGDWLPLFDTILLDAVGRLWIREFVLGSERAWWQVAQGSNTTARLELPASWELLEMGLDYVVVLDQDELGIEVVHKYRLIK